MQLTFKDGIKNIAEIGLNYLIYPFLMIGIGYIFAYILLSL